MLATLMSLVAITLPAAAPSHVGVRHDASGWRLVVDGKPFLIKGAGGDASKGLLARSGGTSFRTWGADGLDDQLDEAQRLGLKVTVGIWLGHKEHGFRYDDPNQVAGQLERVRQTVERYKRHPALLMWALGNEMEGFEQGDDPLVWKAVEEAAKAAKKLDPDHPTMTVIAEIGGRRVASFNQYCPDVDVLGINSYGGAPSLAERYRKAGGTKPYVLGEFGPPGVWELPKNAWGVAVEPTSTAKAAIYRTIYAKAAEDRELCLGSYAFAWGAKQEASATWFGMFLPDGSRLGAVDALAEQWSGKAPATPCPQIDSLTIEGDGRVEPGALVIAKLKASSPTARPLAVEWVLQRDHLIRNVGGEAEAVPPVYPEAILEGGPTGAKVRMPTYPAAYRLFAYVRDGSGGAAVANVPLHVVGEPSPGSAEPRSLPFQLYSSGGASLPFVPSGWMGETASMKLDLADPHGAVEGGTCVRMELNKSEGWGGIAWQAPANDWGDKPGGYDLTGARRLSFKARGARGDESASFAVGLIRRDKPFFDTAIVELPGVHLSKSWEEHHIELKGADLSRIKTGLVVILVAKGSPITIFIDDVKFEK